VKPRIEAGAIQATDGKERIRQAQKEDMGVKDHLRNGLAAGLYGTGALDVLRRFERRFRVVLGANPKRLRLGRFHGSKFAILCYHRVGTGGVPLFSQLHPAVFERQMRYLRRNYRIVSLPQLWEELRNGAAVAPSVAITFDDGYRDLYQHAFTVLQRYQIPATIYLIGESMETGECPWYDRIFVALEHALETRLEVELDLSRQFGLTSPAERRQAAWEIICYLRTLPDAKRREWCAAFDKRMRPPRVHLEDRMLDWSQVRAMQAAGVHFGAHTMTHPSVARLTSPQFEEELLASRTLLEVGMDTAVEDFAYPFGKPADCLPPGDETLPSYGYRSAVTTSEGINSSDADLFRLNRMQIGDDASIALFAFNVARMFLEADPGESSVATTQAGSVAFQLKRKAL
jgi:hypothetical protein